MVAACQGRLHAGAGTRRHRRAAVSHGRSAIFQIALAVVPLLEYNLLAIATPDGRGSLQLPRSALPVE